MWATLALTTALNLAPAQSGIELKNVRFTYGILGPERKDAILVPGDVLVVGFDIDGLTVGKDDRIKYSMGTELTNKKGDSLFKKEPQNLEVVNSLGGSHLPAFALAVIGLDTEPGEYTFTVTVTDGTTGKSEKLSRPFEVVKLKFGLVRLMFSYQSGESAPPLAVAGQSFLLSFTLVGWDEVEKTKEPDVLAEITITDADGKPTLSQPIQGKVQALREDFKKVKVIPMQFPLNLNRAGKFKISITATDKVTKKKVDASLDLTVVEPK